MTDRQAQQDRIEELEMALGQSEDLLISLAARFRLHGIQAQILAMLLQREGITSVGVHAVIYGRRPARSQPSMEALKGHVYQLRRKLRTFGIEMETMIGLGFRLTPQNKQKIRDILAKEAA